MKKFKGNKAMIATAQETALCGMDSQLQRNIALIQFRVHDMHRNVTERGIRVRDTRDGGYEIVTTKSQYRVQINLTGPFSSEKNAQRTQEDLQRSHDRCERASDYTPQTQICI